MRCCISQLCDILGPTISASVLTARLASDRDINGDGEIVGKDVARLG